MKKGDFFLILLLLFRTRTVNMTKLALLGRICYINWSLLPRVHTTNMVAQEALVEASLRAKNLGFHHIIIVTRSKNLKQICNNKKLPH